MHHAIVKSFKDIMLRMFVQASCLILRLFCCVNEEKEKVQRDNILCIFCENDNYDIWQILRKSPVFLFYYDRI